MPYGPPTKSKNTISTDLQKCLLQALSDCILLMQNMYLVVLITEQIKKTKKCIYTKYSLQKI